MPTTYTHDAFGKVVYQKLPEDIKRVIAGYKMAFLIGLHGPDLLFYYRPFEKNEVNERGHAMHEAAAAEFFRRGKASYLQNRDEELLSYLTGFICHYMLDSTCHPYIEEYMKETGAGHDEIETDLDRYLMERHGFNPFRYCPAKALSPERECVRVIGECFEGLDECQIVKAIRSMHFYTALTVCPNPLKRKVLLAVSRAVNAEELVAGRVMMKKRSKRCMEGSAELLRLIRLAIPETVTVIEDFYETIEDENYLNCRFDRNYL